MIPGKSSLPSLRLAQIGLLVLILTFFLVRNMPWHVDNYDQAKQAFVSVEMLEEGEWFHGHTPRGDSATKPPFMGWLSAGLAAMGFSWGWAWRLPSLMAALGLMVLLHRHGRRLFESDWMAILVVVVFSVNVLSNRLATLVRTDMVLCLLIAAGGLLILSHLRDQREWTVSEKVWLGVIITVSMLTKGPLVYLFLLAPLVAYRILQRKAPMDYSWSGWLPWLLPWIPFLAWAAIGALTNEEFYEQVVVKEFLARFQTGSDAVHKSQPIYFYGPHLILKFAPWSLLLITILCMRRKFRESLRSRPELLWLVVWALVPLVLMSLIPSKRVDRIYPIIPALSLLTVAAICHLKTVRFGKWQLNTGVTASVIAILSMGIYIGSKLDYNYGNEAHRFRQFGVEAREILDREQLNWELLQTSREGLMPYMGHGRFIGSSEGGRRWASGELDALVMDNKMWEKLEDQLAGTAEIRLEGKGPVGYTDRFFLVIRTEGPDQTKTGASEGGTSPSSSGP